MLTSYDAKASKLVEAKKLPASGWVHAFEPTPSELEAIIGSGVPEDFLEHVLDVDEVARIEHGPHGATLVILRVPWRRSKSHGLPYRSESLGIVLLPKRIVTIARHETHVIDALAEKPGIDGKKPLRMLLLLAAATAECFLADLREMDHAVEGVERRLATSTRNKEVIELLKYQKALVHFTQAIGSNQIVLDRLAKDQHLEIDGDDKELLEDVLVELHQANELANIASSMLSSTMDAFASIISNNLNAVMKVLTSITIVLTIPVLISSLYGMNVDLPGDDRGHAFHVIVGVALVLSAAVAAAFRKWRWL